MMLLYISLGVAILSITGYQTLKVKDVMPSIYYSKCVVSVVVL